MKETKNGNSEANGLKIDRATKTLRELAYDNVRQAIFDAHFPPGTRLIERSLCQDLDVSRTVVREVLRQLDAEGLVETIPHVGPIVATMDWDKAKQIYEVRGTLEAMAIRSCAKLASKDDIALLETKFNTISAAFDMDSPNSILNATTEFYNTLFLIGEKPFAWTVVQSLNARISQLRAMTITTPERHLSSITEMKEIITAISSGDIDAAETASWKHVNAAAAVAEQLLNQNSN
ncbi:MAG: GntR family transcriptional regulator [Arenicella sp.]